VKIKYLIFPLLLALDVMSKAAAIHWIPPLQWGSYPFGGISLFSDFFGISFSLNTIVNTGAAWGLFSGHPGLLFGLRTFLVAGLGVYLYIFHRPITKMASLWLVAVGAIGNAIDYLLYGHVIDFFHFIFWGYSFPIFNLADSYITLGVIALMFSRKNASVRIV
jgi:signal peptidase II